MQRPFEKLKDLAVKTSELPAALGEKYDPPALSLPDNLAEKELFDWAMRDVVPLEWSSAEIANKERPASRPPGNGEAEALRDLQSLVDGEGPFDFTCSDEYIERAVVPGARALLRKLRRGHYSVQAVLDLHGMDREQARRSVEAFIFRAVAFRRGCVKIIHGRGHNSKENRAVLKELLQLWLATRRMSRFVLAYTSAQPCDGGAGAVYVLLRKPQAPANGKRRR